MGGMISGEVFPWPQWNGRPDSFKLIKQTKPGGGSPGAGFAGARWNCKEENGTGRERFHGRFPPQVGPRPEGKRPRQWRGGAYLQNRRPVSGQVGGGSRVILPAENTEQFRAGFGDWSRAVCASSLRKPSLAGPQVSGKAKYRLRGRRAVHVEGNRDVRGATGPRLLIFFLRRNSRKMQSEEIGAKAVLPAAIADPQAKCPWRAMALPALHREGLFSRTSSKRAHPPRPQTQGLVPPRAEIARQRALPGTFALEPPHFQMGVREPSSMETVHPTLMPNSNPVVTAATYIWLPTDSQARSATLLTASIECWLRFHDSRRATIIPAKSQGCGPCRAQDEINRTSITCAVIGPARRVMLLHLFRAAFSTIRRHG